MMTRVGHIIGIEITPVAIRPENFSTVESLDASVDTTVGKDFTVLDWTYIKARYEAEGHQFLYDLGLVRQPNHGEFYEFGGAVK